MVSQPSDNNRRLKWSSNKLGFNKEDHPISTKVVGTIPIVCSPIVNNIAVNHTLIDGGASLNIISVEVFEKMQVPYHRLMPTRPFFGVTKGSTTPIGQVRLPVTFGTRDIYRMESLDFDVTYIALPYNAILGYPALAQFMAAMHHGFNVLKIPSTHGTITVRCNEKDALRSVEHVYCEAATMFPPMKICWSTQATSLERSSSCHKSGLLPRRLRSSPFCPACSGRSHLHLHQLSQAKISSIPCWT
jgi:hypothetical protein